MAGAAKSVARCAVMTALLIAVQLALGFLPGVELVTVFLLSFCYVRGVREGVVTATAFSLLRCVLWGLYPNVLVLYLVYFNLFALLFGSVRRVLNVAAWLCPLLLLVLAAGCAVGGSVTLPVSRLQAGQVRGLFWALFGVLAALVLLFPVLMLRGGGRGREGAVLASLAAVCTVCFTLLDDLITPLMLGYSAEAGTAYFYASLLTMLPQTICATVSVLLLCPVLVRIFGGGGKSPPSNVGRMGKDMV